MSSAGARAPVVAPPAVKGSAGDLFWPLLAMVLVAAAATALGLWRSWWWALLAAEFTLVTLICSMVPISFSFTIFKAHITLPTNVMRKTKIPGTMKN